MDSKKFKELFESYSAVYDETLKDSIEEETLSFVDELTDGELDIVVEEVIDELIEEGYEFNQVQEIFEEVIGEDLELLEEIELVSECLQECGLNEFGAEQVLNSPQYFEVLDSLVESVELNEARRSGSIEPVSKSGKPIAGLKGGAKSAAIRGKQAAKSARDTGVERPSQMKAALRSQSQVADSAKQKLKVATKTAKVSQPKTSSSSDAVKDKTASSAWLKKRRDQRAAKRESAAAKAGEQQAKARAKNISNIRKEKEAAVASKEREVHSRARNIRNIRIGKAVRKGIAQAQVGAYNKAREVKQSASDTAARVSQSAKNRMAGAKRGIKKAIGRVAGKVASAAGKVASRAAGVASKMQEENDEFDVFDVVMEHLLEEGYADTEDAALSIMANMSEEWREEIIDEARRADALGYARGTAANPSRKDVPHGDPSQRSMLHSKIKRRADEMGRARRNSPRYKEGGRPALSKKEKSFLQASDRTRQSIRNPNVPDTGRHQNVGRYDREDQKNPKRNPKHDANKG